MKPRGHSIYFMHLDLIAHHFVLEVKEGLARVHQCNLVALTTESFGCGGGGRVPVAGSGYTAGQWERARPCAHWPLALVAAHGRMGGGRELSNTRLRGLLATLQELLA